MTASAEIAIRTAWVVGALVAACAVSGLFMKPGPFRRNFWRRFRTMIVLIVAVLGTAFAGGWTWTVVAIVGAAQWELWAAFGARPVVALSVGAALPVAARLGGPAGLRVGVAVAMVGAALAGGRHAAPLALGLGWLGGLGACLVLVESAGGFGALLLLPAGCQ